MTDDSSRPADPKAVWQGQPREIEPMALETVRRQAVRFQRRRLRLLIQETLAAIVVIMFWGRALVSDAEVLIKVAGGLSIAWAIFYVWQWRRLMSPKRVPDDAVACLDFHRGELERQRDVARGIWRWALAPLAPLILLVAVGRWIGPTPPWRTPWLDHVIIVVGMGFVAETLALMALWTLHRADKWQDRIDELDALGSDSP